MCRPVIRTPQQASVRGCLAPPQRHLHAEAQWVRTQSLSVSERDYPSGFSRAPKTRNVVVAMSTSAVRLARVDTTPVEPTTKRHEAIWLPKAVGGTPMVPNHPGGARATDPGLHVGLNAALPSPSAWSGALREMANRNDKSRQPPPPPWAARILPAYGSPRRLPASDYTTSGCVELECSEAIADNIALPDPCPHLTRVARHAPPAWSAARR